MSRILLTGSSGFIGQSVLASGTIEASYLLDLKDETLVLYSTQQKKEIQRFAIGEIISSLPHDVTQIIHLGAITSTYYSNKNNLNYLNVVTTNALVNISCQKGIKIVFASSASVYGHSNQMSENLVPSRPSNLYAQSKWESEQYISSFCKCKVPHITILRLFNIYGKLEANKGNMSSLVWQFISRTIQREAIVIFLKDGLLPGSQSRDFVFIDDVVRFLSILSKEDESYGILNFGTGVSHKFSEIIDLISATVGDVRVETLMKPPEFYENYQWYTRSDNSRFATLFPNFKFTPLQSGMSHVSEFFRGNADVSN